MGNSAGDLATELFSTCPPINHAEPERYLEQVVATARWSEQAGCRGILVYSDNSQLDPWLVSHVIIQNTRSLCPLVAVQPVYMHPYTVAKAIASLAQLYGRRIYLNMVAGGFTNDLAALNDPTPHDRRYERLLEYTRLILQLLRGEGPLNHTGEFYTVHNLRLQPQCPAELLPGVLMSGSSEAGLAAARALGATAIQYPKPASEYPRAAAPSVTNSGIRIGIVARADGAQAWAIARERFPEDRKGRLTHQLAMNVSDSVWHKQLSALAKTPDHHPYWLVPFENYKTMCPYLVGSYSEVGSELAGYLALGYRTFITDIPPDPAELKHIGTAFDFARRLTYAAAAPALAQRTGAAPA